MSAACARCGAVLPPGARFCPECGLSQTGGPQPQPARRTVTIVFSDLVESTALGEALDAESLREVLDQYFHAVKAVLERHGGVVEKFIGDAVMAVFGLARMLEDDALRAVRAADEMRSRLASLNDELGSRGVRLQARTGVNTGVVIVGDVSAGDRLATGDAVNVAARLEQAAPTGGILLGPTTTRLVRGDVELQPFGQLSLKGKSEPIAASELVRVTLDAAGPLSSQVRSLVGRRSELAFIEERHDVAVAERGTEFVLVVGEAGVGKSRLLRELADRLTDAHVLVASCRPYGTPSLWPITQLLSRVGATDRLDRDAIVDIASGVASPDRRAVADRVAALLGLSDGRFPMEECFWAVSRLFQSLAERRPLVLVIDDLHWAGDSMLDLIDHLRMAGQGAPCLILGSSRPEILARRWSTGAVWHQETVELRELSSADSDACIDVFLGDSRVPVEVRTQVRRAAEGNPLFLEQALMTWVDSGVIVLGPGGWELTRPITEVEIPESVAAIFASRLDRLEQTERRAIEAAAVVGPVFSRQAVSSILAESGVSGVDGALDRLVAAGLLHPVELRVTGGLGLGFVHASLHDVAYDMTLKSERAALHERYAGWREAMPDHLQADGLIGHHLAAAYAYRVDLRQTGDATAELGLRAARRLARECQRALAVGDRSTADRLAARVLDVLSSAGPSVASKDMELVEATARLLVTLGSWEQAVSWLRPFAETDRGPLIRDLGVALCQLSRAQPQSDEYREGQRLLLRATELSPDDPDAVASLAGTWKGVDDELADRLYRACLALDPGNPYALGNVVEFAIERTGDLVAVGEMRGQIERARLRCRAQADSGSNLPWAFYDAGKFDLILGDPYAAIAAYAKAVQLSTAEHMIATSMTSLTKLSAVEGGLAGCSWAIDLLELARAVRFASDTTRGALAGATAIDGVTAQTPVIILAGGTDETARAWLSRHGRELSESFGAFRGLVVSGGTNGGIAGLSADIRELHHARITAVGYAPASMPDDAVLDARYDEVRQVPDDGFSIAQTMRAFSDLVASGVTLTDVKLFGVNGGQIAAAEYRVALALGCLVGVVAGSGREADRLFADPDWVAAPNLIRIDEDSSSVRRFLLSEE